MGRAGTLLWHRAASVLGRIAQAPPADCLAEWLASGLPGGELAPVASALAAILTSAASAVQPEVIGPDAAAELGGQATLLQTLSVQISDADARRRVARIQSRLQAGALHRLDVSLQERVTTAMAMLPQTPQSRDEALDSMESAARMLRGFELEARRLGPSQELDALVQRTCKTVNGVADLSTMDKARLTEILAGPEAALRLLKQQT